MTPQDRRWLWLCTGAPVLLGLAAWGLVRGLRWAMSGLLLWLREIQIDTLVAGALLLFASWCVVVALLSAQPRFRWLPDRRGR